MNEKASLDPNLLISAYRQPLIALLIRRCACERAAAERIIDEFLAPTSVAHWLPQYDASHEHFRTFVQLRAIEFASPGLTEFSRDDSPGHDVDAQFEQDWIQGVLQIALHALRVESDATKRPQAFGIFERYDLFEHVDRARPTYAAMAREWNLPTTQVTNYLAWARRQFRHHVLETLGGLTGSEAEFWGEVRALLGDDIVGDRPRTSGRTASASP